MSHSSSPYQAQQIEIPSELPTLLRNFTLSVLRTKPRDIVEHGVLFFTQLYSQRKEVTAAATPSVTPSSATHPSSSTNHNAHAPATTAHRSSIPADDVSSTEWTREHHPAQSTFSPQKMAELSSRLESRQPNSSEEIQHYSPPVSSPTTDEEERTSSDGDEEDEKANSIDELANDEAVRKRYVHKNEYRRVSVAAERYNPEEDNDSDSEQNQVYSKSIQQRARLKDAVSQNLLFRTLEPKQMDQILNAMYEKGVQAGDVIIRQGEDGDNFYVIDRGIFDIYVSKVENQKGVKVGEYDNKGSFGELALMYNQPRSATIVAQTDGILWVMGRQTFRRLVLKHAFRKRLMYENFLRELSILREMTDYERSNVADALIPVEYSRGDVIIKQGDEGSCMFFIEEGECDILMNDKFHKQLAKGDYFGELALLNHEPRSATVVAASQKVKLASLEVESFERLMGPCMDLIKRNTSAYTTA